MLTPRAFLATGALNRKMYAIGGMTATAASAANEVYTPGDVWVIKRSIEIGIESFAAAVVSGKFYTLAGWTGTGVSPYAHAYDPGSRNSARCHTRAVAPQQHRSNRQGTRDGCPACI